MPFRLVSKSTTLGNLERPIRTLLRLLQKRCIFHVSVYCQRQKCRPMTLVSGGIRYICGYSRRFPEEGASNDSGVVDNGNFQRFRELFFEYFRDKANIIIQRYAVRRRFLPRDV